MSDFVLNLRKKKKCKNLKQQDRMLRTNVFLNEAFSYLELVFRW